MGGIKTMFDPKTIALIGATEHSGAVGRAILENLLPPGNRKKFPVNPHKEKMFGVLSRKAGFGENAFLLLSDR